MNYYRCQANSITFHFLTVTRKVNFLKVLMSMFSFPTTAHRGGGYGIFVCCQIIL